MGVWPLDLQRTSVGWAQASASKLVTPMDCVQACKGCAQCRYISYSLAQRVCAWFAHCPAASERKTDVGRLLYRSWTKAGWDERGTPQTWHWHAAKTFKTVEVR